MTVEPLDVAFDRRMAALGPFEPRPALAVAVSGGPDSLAACLLADRWARARDGRSIGLTVDHGLRPAAAAEARQVGRWLAARGIAHHVLRWQAAAPAAGIQAAARQARYRLMEDWCVAHGVLHLVLGHQREDQAETLMLRLARGSGVHGLAAMAPVTESRGLRLLRPLLDEPRHRLVEFLAECGQGWIDDPSNRDPAFARVRMRAALTPIAATGLSVARLADTARRMGRARAALEGAAARLLAAAATPHPAGFCVLDGGALTDAPAEIGLRALAQVLMCIGGAEHPPRLARLEALHAAILAPSGRFAGRTLAGCRVMPRPGRRGELLIAREPAAATESRELRPGTPRRLSLAWDRRFRLEVTRPASGRQGIRIARLGAEGWRAVVAGRPELRGSAIPAPARPALPALWQGDTLAEVPHLFYRDSQAAGSFAVAAIRFEPAHPLAGTMFAVV